MFSDVSLILWVSVFLQCVAVILALRLILQIWAYIRALIEGGDNPVAVPLIEDAAAVAAAEAESLMGEGK